MKILNVQMQIQKYPQKNIDHVKKLFCINFYIKIKYNEKKKIYQHTLIKHMFKPFQEDAFE